MTDTIVLCPNPYRDRGILLTSRAKELLESDGRRVLISPVFVDVPEGGGMAPLSRAIRDASLVISFGGDGTFLHVARTIMRQKIPMLGVNLGTKGFMAGLEPDDVALVRKAAAGEYRASRRMMLDVELLRGGEPVYADCALNDVVIKSPLNCIDLEVASNGVVISNYSGDGVIIATPTGSTAYSLSAGGPIVEPEAENIIVTPICAHIMAARTFVLSPEREVTVTPERLKGRPSLLTADGCEPVTLESGDVIRVRRSENSIILADMGVRSFYDTALDKLTKQDKRGWVE